MLQSTRRVQETNEIRPDMESSDGFPLFVGSQSPTVQGWIIWYSIDPLLALNISQQTSLERRRTLMFGERVTNLYMSSVVHLFIGS